MIAEGLERALGLAAYAAVALAAIAYLLGSFRKGRFAAAAETADIWREEYEVLKERQSRLEGDLRTEREARASLERQLAEQQRLTDDLRKMVMLDRIPKALDDALTGITTRIIGSIDETNGHLAETEDRIGQGILTMSDAITKAISQLHEQQIEWAKDLIKTPPGESGIDALD